MDESIRYDQEAARLETILPAGPRVVIIGSTSFWHADSERTCQQIGRLLATIPGLVLITGGVEGIGEATGRGFFQARREACQEARVYHVLPHGEEAWDYGETHHAGRDMHDRREVLARLARVYLAIEGGPGTVHEAEVASARGAIVLPVGRSGGHAGVLYTRLKSPSAVDEQTWAVLGSPLVTPEETAAAAFRAVGACLEIGC